LEFFDSGDLENGFDWVWREGILLRESFLELDFPAPEN
jgi:hypothetical protein